jgi:xanthine dehydrogenase accessory factor
MTCGGTVEVLVEPMDSDSASDPVARARREAEAEVGAGRVAVIAIPLDGSSGRLLVRQDGSCRGTLGSATLDAEVTRGSMPVIAGESSGVQRFVIGGEEHRVYLERHAPATTLVIFGATHVAMALVPLARVLGLRTVVIDGRERFATRERFPDVDELIVGMPSEIAERLSLGPASLVVLLSHDYKYDLPVLRKVLASDAAYVGLLGSARRGRALLEFLREEGIPETRLARVRVPVGLDIGALTAEEIALSVIAEAVAVQRGRSGGPMRERNRVNASRGPSPAA